MELKARTTEFQEDQFVHESRSSNGDTHGLAKGMVSDADFLTVPVPTGLNLICSSLAIRANIFSVWCLFCFDMVYI
jgi:hypothetical protein